MRKLLLPFLILFPLIAFAMSLTEARNGGYIAENDHGYVEVVISNQDVLALANEVNSKRKAEYTKIAEQTGTSLNEVEIVSAKKIWQSLASGNLIKINGLVSKK